MLKKTVIYFIVICVVYTILTVTSSTIYLIQGDEYDSHLHLINRFVITSIGVLSIWAYDLLRNYLKKYALFIHYPIVMGFVFGYVWFNGLFVELHPNAYRDIFFNFTAIYLLISLGLLGSWIYKTKKGKGIK